MEISEISNRILDLSSEFSSNKEFLDKCEITNHSLISDIRRGKIKTPGSDILVKIVQGTGCSGSWLLAGIGDKYPVINSSKDKSKEELLDKEKSSLQSYFKQLGEMETLFKQTIRARNTQVDEKLLLLETIKAKINQTKLD